MLLTIQDLRVRFRMGRAADIAYADAVGRGDTGVSFDVPENTTVALVAGARSASSAATCWPRRWRSCRRCAGARSPAYSRIR
jgi:hypothetical protein